MISQAIFKLRTFFWIWWKNPFSSSFYKSKLIILYFEEMRIHTSLTRKNLNFIFNKCLKDFKKKEKGAFRSADCKDVLQY